MPPKSNGTGWAAEHPGHVCLATNTLVAEFNLANSTPLARARLPADFNYAGAISMAGAFWLKPGTALTWAKKPCPIMFFHGAKDQLVTYDESQAAFAAYGAAYFQRMFKAPDYSSWFVDLPEADHVMSVAPLIDYDSEIDAFLSKLVRDKQAMTVHVVETDAVPKMFQNFRQLYGRFLPSPASKDK